MQQRSADTPLFPSTDRGIEKLVSVPLSLLDAKRLAIIRFVFLLTGICVFALGLVQSTIATVASLMMIIFVVAGAGISASRKNGLTRNLVDGLRTARAGAAGLIVFNLFLAALVIVTGPLLGNDTAQHLTKAACYALMSFPLYTLPLTYRERPMRMAADLTENPRAEYEKIKGELVDLDRKERSLLDRKAELERHPDINRT